MFLDSVKSSIFCALTNSRKQLQNTTILFCDRVWIEENGSSSCCDVYPGRSALSSFLISLRMVQYTFEKCAEMPSRGAIDCCRNISDLKKDILYNLLAIWSANGTIRRKRWLILSNRNKRTQSERTIEELSLEFVLHTFKRKFSALT